MDSSPLARSATTPVFDDEADSTTTAAAATTTVPTTAPTTSPPTAHRTSVPNHLVRPGTPRTDGPRNVSPLVRAHLRSRSPAASPAAPPMTRAHSLPTFMQQQQQQQPPITLSPSPLPAGRPSSPLRSPKRTRSPFRACVDDAHAQHSGAPSVCDISEDAELDLTPKAGPAPAPAVTFPLHSPLARSSSHSRRRPASPLHQVSVPFDGSSVVATTVSTPASMPSTTSSPMLAASRFNEPFPGMGVGGAYFAPSLASSSVPSTPTSMRSRSPSMSSLETIPDSPDAEAEAIEADRLARIARVQAVVVEEQRRCDAAVGGAAASRGRPSLDGSSSFRGGGGAGLVGFGKRDMRKRWSVCGAERRGDLDLETIWED